MAMWTIVKSKPKVRGKQHCTPARPTHTACSHKIMISWTSTHDVDVASAGSGGLIHARHGAFQELAAAAYRQSVTRGSTRPPCCRRPHLRAVQASHEPCRGSQAAEGPRRARRRGCMGLRTQKRSAQKRAHVASVRARRGCPCAARPANMMVQQPCEMAHARE
jgi:hypothetical protein